MEKISMETLKKYVEEGWRARIKTMKGHRYIVLRLRGKDKSLGPYNEDLWKKLEALGMTPIKRVKYMPGKDSSGVSLADLQKQVNSLAQRQTRFSNALAKWKEYPKSEMVKLREKLKVLEKMFSKKGAKGKLRAEDVIYTRNIRGRPTNTLADILNQMLTVSELLQELTDNRIDSMEKACCEGFELVYEELAKRERIVE